MRIIYTDKAPEPTGHRSQAIVHDETIYVSGQLAVDPAKPGSVPESMGDQTAQALANVDAILKEAGTEFKNVLKLTVFITEMSEWKDVDKVFGEKFGDHKPARSVVQVNRLHHDAKIQIEATAFIPESRPFWH
ncbi:RidA family protein [candidate division KSB1 bacterium]